MSVDPKKYLDFVNQVTSDESKDGVAFVNRLRDLEGDDCQIHRLLTAAVGISAEGGEFMEIVKKMVFQGKPWDDHNRKHLVIELGDVMWYVMQACMALNITLDDVIANKVNFAAKLVQTPTGTPYLYIFDANMGAEPNKKNTLISVRPKIEYEGKGAIRHYVEKKPHLVELISIKPQERKTTRKQVKL